MEEGIHITETDHYEMPLPFKMDVPDLPNNQYQAEKRLQSLRRIFTQDAIYHAEYAKVMDSLIANDYAEFIPDPAHYEKSRWYIPHHGAQYKNEYLNKHLMTGQSRFRLEKVAFMCDVKEMFHQFGVNKEHQDYLRFLWWPKGEYQHPVQHYRMNIHLFGAASSPGCANYGLKKIASDDADKFGHDVASFIHNIYVDDGLLSVSTSAEAIDMIHRTKKMCLEGKLHLHKLVSNSREVMQTSARD